VNVKGLRIQRAGRRVRLVIDANILGIEEHQFVFEGDEQVSEIYGQIVTDSMREGFGAMIEQIRRESYEMGWKHANGKKHAKLTSFWTAARRA